jgi:hypothetical protein
MWYGVASYQKVKSKVILSHTRLKIWLLDVNCDIHVYKVLLYCCIIYFITIIICVIIDVTLCLLDTDESIDQLYI